jgi:hypothetical protein
VDAPRRECAKMLGNRDCTRSGGSVAHLRKVAASDGQRWMSLGAT